MATKIGHFGLLVNQHIRNASQMFQSIVDQNVNNTMQHLTSWASEVFVIITRKTEETPSFQNKKNDCQKDLLKFQTVSVAALVANLTFTIIGFGFCLARYPFTGSGFLLVNLPLSYGTYNFYRLLENSRDVIQNPKNYIQITQETEKKEKIDLDYERILFQITKTTFCFEWAAHWIIDPLKAKLAPLEYSKK